MAEPKRPCPKCGGRMEAFLDRDEAGELWYGVQCGNCGFSTDVVPDSMNFKDLVSLLWDSHLEVGVREAPRLRGGEGRR